MKKALARALSGNVGLGESPSHDAAPVDRLHAIAAAQRRETYADYRDADARSYLASLGVDLVRLKLANVAGAYEPCKERLTVALMWRGNELRIKEAAASIIAAQCLTEFVIDFCPTCSGTGEVKDHSKTDGREGATPMRVCPTCGGHGMRRYTDEERSEAIGEARRLAKAFEAAHALMGQAIREALWNARQYMKD